MDCSQAVLTLFLLVPCDPGGGHSGDAATHPRMDPVIAEAPVSPERIKYDLVGDDLVGDCFIVDGEIGAPTTLTDDHSQSVFAEGVRDGSDRVVCKVRPQEASAFHRRQGRLPRDAAAILCAWGCRDP